MKQTGTLCVAILLGAALLVGGCTDINFDRTISPSQGTTRVLGDSSYQQAFAAGRQVMSRYYSIDPVKTSVERHMIQSRPTKVSAGKERLVGSSEARVIARMYLFQEAGQVTARVQVMRQRQGNLIRQQMGYSMERRNYSGNPGDETPADVSAAVTPDQNDAWENEKRLRDIERKIVDELSALLQGRK